MGGGNRRGQDWNDQEIYLIVSDYFAMLEMQMRGDSFVKSHRNSAMQQLIGRSSSSIEFKHRNISAVLFKIGLEWVKGYYPAMHFQDALTEGVARHLKSHSEMLTPLLSRNNSIAEEASLFVGPAPQKIDRSEERYPSLARLIKKFDPALRDERNRQLGKLGEERVFYSERARLCAAGREDLSRKVRWVAQEDGDGAGFDVLSFTDRGDERFLEVKTTAGGEQTPFYISSNEKLFSEERQDAFRIFRLYDFARAPKAFEIAPPLESQLILKAANYKASFK